MKILSYQKSAKQYSNEFYVLDVETYSLKATMGNLWFGCIYGNNYKAIFRNHKEFHLLLQTGRFYNKIIYAHNGGRFDYLVLFGNLLAGEVIYSGARFISYKYKHIVFADSLNLLSDTVANIGAMVGYPKLELENKGSIAKGAEPSEKDIEYCFRDCEIVYEALCFMFQDCKPKLTIGSLALDIFKRKFLQSKIKFNEAIEDYYIPAYYGGRTEMFTTGKVHDCVYDINSMYPYIMATTIFPHPSYSYKIFNPSVARATQLIYEKEGVINCVVYVPETIEYCPLPVIYNDRLLFAYGTFKGSFCFNELRMALDLGCKLISVNNICSSTRLLQGKDLFGDFVDTHYKLKVEATSDIERWANKYILNNLYGKFGQHRLCETKYFTDKNDAAFYIASLPDSWLWEIKEYNKKRKDCYIEKEVDKMTSHSIISIAAYITSASRVLLYKYICKYKPDYCDTDSLFLPMDSTTFPPESTLMGDLKLENYWVSNIKGCKDYTKHKMKDGKEVIIEMIKGIRKGAEQIGPNKFRQYSLASPRTALRRGMEIGSQYPIEKTLKRIYTKGTISGQKVIPLTIDMTKIN